MRRVMAVERIRSLTTRLTCRVGGPGFVKVHGSSEHGGARLERVYYMHPKRGPLVPTSHHNAYVAWWIGYSIHSHGRTCGCPGRRGRPLRTSPFEKKLHRFGPALNFSIIVRETEKAKKLSSTPNPSA
eukprot:scaffold2178_cov363-Pavlova_lutheri.AAC.2